MGQYSHLEIFFFFKNETAAWHEERSFCHQRGSSLRHEGDLFKKTKQWLCLMEDMGAERIKKQ